MDLNKLNEEIARSEQALEELRQKRQKMLEEERKIDAAAAIIVHSGINKKYFKIAINRSPSPEKRVILFTVNHYKRMKCVNRDFLKEIPKSITDYFYDNPLIDACMYQGVKYTRLRSLPEKTPTTKIRGPSCIVCNKVFRKYGNNTCPYRVFCGPCASNTVYTGNNKY